MPTHKTHLKLFSLILILIPFISSEASAGDAPALITGRPAALIIEALQLAGVRETLARTTMYSVAAIDCSKGNNAGVDPQDDHYLLGHDFICQTPSAPDQAVAKALMDGLDAAGVAVQTVGNADHYKLNLLQCEINRAEQTIDSRFVCMVSP